MTHTHAAKFQGTVGRLGRSLPRSKLFALLLVTIMMGPGVTASRAQERNQVISIEDAYRMALQTHELIRISEKEIDKSKLGPKKALSMMLPHAKLIGGYQQVNKPINNSTFLGNVIILPKDQTLGDITVKNSIYNPNYFPARRRANETINRTADNCHQTIQNVLLQVGQQYYQVLRAGELIQNAKDLIKTAQEEVRLSKVKYASGAVTEDVVLRALMDLSTAENKLIMSTNLSKLAKDNLRNLIALKTGRYDVVKPAHLKEPNQSYATLLSSAYEHRFDHKMALSDVELAKTNVESVKAKFHPSVNASWEYYAVNHPNFYQESNNWAAIVSVTLPVLEGGLRVWELKEAKETLEQAKLSLADKRRNIKMEVENALLTVHNNKSLLAQVQTQVNLAKKNYEIVFSRFKYGAATILDVSQAFVALDTAKTDLINKTYDYQTSLLNLQWAQGIFVLDLIAKKRFHEVSSSPVVKRINNKK